MSNFNVGDSVVVKIGIEDPDFPEFALDGYQGRVIAIEHNNEDNETYLDIEWDSITLINMPEAHLKATDDEGLDFTKMTLTAECLEPANPRDTPEEVEKAQNKILAHLSFDFEEQDKRIEAIISKVGKNATITQQYQAWKEHLLEILDFPFKAVTEETLNKVAAETEVMIIDLNKTDEGYGLMADIMYNGERLIMPLSNLFAEDEETPAAQAIDDYYVWFNVM